MKSLKYLYYQFGGSRDFRPQAIFKKEEHFSELLISFKTEVAI